MDRRGDRRGDYHAGPSTGVCTARLAPLSRESERARSWLNQSTGRLESRSRVWFGYTARHIWPCSVTPDGSSMSISAKDADISENEGARAKFNLGAVGWLAARTRASPIEVRRKNFAGLEDGHANFGRLGVLLSTVGWPNVVFRYHSEWGGPTAHQPKGPSATQTIW